MLITCVISQINYINTDEPLSNPFLKSMVFEGLKNPDKQSVVK